MAQTIAFARADAPESIKRRYPTTREFRLIVTDSVAVPGTSGLWDSGSRDMYYAMELASGNTLPLVDSNAAFTGAQRDTRYTLKPGIAVIQETVFCGKDMPPRIYITAADAAPILPAAVELTDTERKALTATRSYKSSYGGKDRYQLARDDSYGKPFPSRADWDSAKAALIGRGLLDKRGAITPAGRNAIA